MARQKRKIDSQTENQLSLFDMIEEINPRKFAMPDYQEETKPVGLRVKEAMSEAMKNSGLKRYEIAGRMGELIGIEITESMLNAWTAESKESHRLPVEYLPAFCRVTQDYTVLEITVSACGCHMAKPNEIYLLEMGRLQQAEKTIKRKQIQLEKEWQRSRGER